MCAGPALVGGHQTIAINKWTAALREGKLDEFFERSQALYAAISAIGPPVKPLIKNRTYHMRKYAKCMKGDQLLDWLVALGKCSSRVEAEALCATLLMFGVLHHVCDDHHFKVHTNTLTLPLNNTFTTRTNRYSTASGRTTGHTAEMMLGTGTRPSKPYSFMDSFTL